MDASAVATGLPAPSLAAWRERQAAARVAELSARHPHWVIFRGRDRWWYARRRGSFRCEKDPDAPQYVLRHPDSGLLGVHLRLEDAALRPAPGSCWSL